MNGEESFRKNNEQTKTKETHFLSNVLCDESFALGTTGMVKKGIDLMTLNRKGNAAGYPKIYAEMPCALTYCPVARCTPAS
jgi:hypothetical protein